MSAVPATPIVRRLPSRRPVDETRQATASGGRALVSRAKSGDLQAFEHLVRQHADLVYRVAYRVVGNAQDAQDVSQRALLSAWQGLASFRDEAAFSTWLFQITHRHALNCASRTPRAARLIDQVERADPRHDPASVALGNDAAAQVRAAVASLPDAQQTVIRLYHFEQRSYAEIAKATSSTQPAVRSHLYRARRSLACTLADRR